MQRGDFRINRRCRVIDPPWYEEDITRLEIESTERLPQLALWCHIATLAALVEPQPPSMGRRPQLPSLHPLALDDEDALGVLVCVDSGLEAWGRVVHICLRVDPEVPLQRVREHRDRPPVELNVVEDNRAVRGQRAADEGAREEGAGRVGVHVV